MFTYTDSTGAELTREPQGVKLRIAKCFQKPGQKLKNVDPTAPGIMDEIAPLSAQDLADFAAWFEQEGYPIRATV